MSATPSVAISCDRRGDKCIGLFVKDRCTVPKARAAAKKQGWRYYSKEKQDICPECRVL